jgi:hypothetical protein
VKLLMIAILLAGGGWAQAEAVDLSKNADAMFVVRALAKNQEAMAQFENAGAEIETVKVDRKSFDQGKILITGVRVMDVDDFCGEARLQIKVSPDQSGWGIGPVYSHKLTLTGQCGHK